MFKGVIFKKQGAAIINLVAALAIMFVLFTSGCAKKTQVGEMVDMEKVPRQVGDSIFASQSTNGKLVMRLEAARMEKYENDSLTYDLFPDGFDVYSYDDGNLETHIHSKVARHTTWKSGKEKWEVMGDVEIVNFMNGEKMLTDTLYWDRYEHKIFTHCFVKMSSPRGYLQGYGMESDEMARNAIILRPFDSFTRIGSDSLIGYYVDSANFIGPQLSKKKQPTDLKIENKEDDL